MRVRFLRLCWDQKRALTCYAYNANPVPLSGNVLYFKGTENTLNQRASDKAEYFHRELIPIFFI